MFKGSLQTAAAFALVAAVLGGCASSEKADSDDMAVMCSKCETVWTLERDFLGGRSKVKRLQLKPEMQCAKCDKQAEAYLEGDQEVLHECPDCKVAPKAVRSQTYWNAYKRGRVN